MSKDRLI
jgi:hypothetical protein